MPPSIVEYSHNVEEDAHAPQIKYVCTVVKIGKKKNKVWRLEGVGCQLDLEGLQRCLAYYILKELVPQDDSSWEEALLVVLFVGQLWGKRESWPLVMLVDGVK